MKMKDHRKCKSRTIAYMLALLMLVGVLPAAEPAVRAEASSGYTRTGTADSVSIGVPVNVVLSGSHMPTGAGSLKFHFTLYPVSANLDEGTMTSAQMPMPNKDGITVNCPTGFGEAYMTGYGVEASNPWQLSFTQTGTYRYRIEECDRESDYIVYDGGHWNVYIYVTEEDDVLQATVVEDYEKTVSELSEDEFWFVKNVSTAGSYSVDDGTTILTIGGSATMSVDYFDRAAVKSKFAIDFTRSFKVNGWCSAPKYPDGCTFGFVPNGDALSITSVKDMYANGTYALPNQPVYQNGKGIFLELDSWGNTNNPKRYMDEMATLAGVDGRHMCLVTTDAYGYPSTAVYHDGSKAYKWTVINDTTLNKAELSQYKGSYNVNSVDLSLEDWPCGDHPSNYTITYDKDTKVLTFSLGDHVFEYYDPVSFFGAQRAYLYMGGNIRQGPVGKYSVTSTTDTNKLAFKSFYYTDRGEDAVDAYGVFEYCPGYGITFDNNDYGDEPEKIWIHEGDGIDTPPTLSEPGCVFTGWYKDPGCTEEWDFDDDVPDEPVTLYAGWKYEPGTTSFEYSSDGYEIKRIGSIQVPKTGKTVSEAAVVSIGISDGPIDGDYIWIKGLDNWVNGVKCALEMDPPTIRYWSGTYEDKSTATILSAMPSAPGDYCVELSVTVSGGSGSEFYEVHRLYTIQSDSTVESDEALEDANEGSEPSYINRAYGYILYESDKHRDDAIRHASDDNGAEVETTYLNMTTEKVVTGMEVACYTFNGTTWKAGNLETVNAQLGKALNNQVKLKIASAYDDKKKKPAESATVYSFGTIKRRDNTNSFTVNYFLCRDDYGLTNGQWCLVNAQKKDRGVNLDTYEIGICDNGKTIGSKGYGVWPADGIFPTCGGVWVSDLLSTGKAGKEVYLYRKAATADTVASKPKKITVSTVLAAPKIKVDYKKESLKLKEGMSIYFGATMPEYNDLYFSVKKLPATRESYEDYAGRALLKITKNNARVAIDISGYITETRNSLKIWQGATAKKPTTAIQTISLAARGAVPTAEQCVTVKDGVAKLNKGYEIKTGTGKNAKWTTSIPKATKDVEYQVRRKLDVKGGAENDTTFASGIEGTLKLTYGTYDEVKKKKGFISATVEHD